MRLCSERPSISVTLVIFSISLLSLVPDVVLAADGTSNPATKSVEITASKLNFDRDTITISTDQTLELTLHNEGFVKHNFYVKDLDWKLNTLEPDQSATKKLRVEQLPEPGEYTFICDVATHHKAGMKGTLIVKETDDS